MWPNPQETAHLITLTEGILNGKLPFLCSEIIKNKNFLDPKQNRSSPVCYHENIPTRQTPTTPSKNRYA